MEWFEELDFEENPFNLNPLETEFKLIGRKEEAKEILYRIASGSMLLIESKEGAGKTALLKYAIDNFKGKGKVVYADANILDKRLDVANFVRKKPNGMILLMDNVQELSKENNEKIKYYYDQDRIKAIIFTTTKHNLINFTDAIRSRIGRNIIRLRELNEDEAIEIIKERLGSNEILSEDKLKSLFETSTSLKDYLKRCEIACKNAVSDGRKSVEDEDLEDIDIKENKKSNIVPCSECGEKLIWMKGHWRCKNCDLFCSTCGSFVEEEDLECPECGRELKVVEDEEASMV